MPASDDEEDEVELDEEDEEEFEVSTVRRLLLLPDWVDVESESVHSPVGE